MADWDHIHCSFWPGSPFELKAVKTYKQQSDVNCTTLCIAEQAGVDAMVDVKHAVGSSWVTKDLGRWYRIR